MAKILGQTAVEVVPQSDFSARKNENGEWTATQSFEFIKGGLNNYTIQARFPGGGTLGSLDPDCDEIFKFLRLSAITAVQTIVGGWTRITAEFVGFSGGTSTTDPPLPTPIPTYSKRGTTADAPLDEHPKWQDLDASERVALGKLLSGEWAWGPDPFATAGSMYTYVPGDPNLACEPDPITSTDGLAFAERIAQGKTTYKFATYEYFHKWEDNTGISAAQMNDLGKISTPSGSPPTPGTGRDWLMVGADEEQYGSGNFRFTNSLTYLLSDEGGHDSFLQGT